MNFLIPKQLSALWLTSNSSHALPCSSLLAFSTASHKLNVKPPKDLHSSMSSLSRFYKHSEVKENILCRYWEQFTNTARTKMYTAMSSSAEKESARVMFHFILLNRKRHFPHLLYVWNSMIFFSVKSFLEVTSHAKTQQ